MVGAIATQIHRGLSPAYWGERADLVQWGFVGLLKAHDKRDPAMNEAQFRGYARLRVHGEIIDSLRSQVCEDRLSPARSGGAAVTRETPESIYAERERRLILAGYLRTIDPRDRAILLARVSGTGYKEIQQRFGIGETTVWLILRRHKEALGELLALSTPGPEHSCKPLLIA